MSNGTIALVSALVGAAVTGLFAFFNVLFTSISNRKTKLIELSYRDAVAAFSDYLTASSIVPNPISEEYLAKFSGNYARASLYASERTRPVLEKHFLATIRSPESLEPGEAAHALKLNHLRDELLEDMQSDLSGKSKRKGKSDK